MTDNLHQQARQRIASLQHKDGADARVLDYILTALDERDRYRQALQDIANNTKTEDGTLRQYAREALDGA